MPIMDGLTLLENIKGKFPQLDLYLSSAYGSSEYTDRAYSYDIKKFIEKPISLKLIRSIIHDKYLEINAG